MRPKFVFALVIVTAGILSAIFYLKLHLEASSSRPARPEVAISVPGPAANEEVSVPWQPEIGIFSNVPAAIKSVTPEEHQAAVDAEIARIYELSMSHEPASLPPILAGLDSPEKDVRKAAIDAIREFGSKDAIPTLKAAADRTEDISEKIELLEAADFLSLPGMDFDGISTVLTPEQIQAKAYRRNLRQPKQQPQPAAPNNY